MAFYGALQFGPLEPEFANGWSIFFAKQRAINESPCRWWTENKLGAGRALGARDVSDQLADEVTSRVPNL